MEQQENTAKTTTLRAGYNSLVPDITLIYSTNITTGQPLNELFQTELPTAVANPLCVALRATPVLANWAALQWVRKVKYWFNRSHR